MTNAETMTQTFLDSHPELLGDTDLDITLAAQGFAVDHYEQYGADGFPADLLAHVRALLSVVRPVLQETAVDGGITSTFSLPPALTDKVRDNPRGPVVLRGLYFGLVTALLMEGGVAADDGRALAAAIQAIQDVTRAVRLTAVRAREFAAADVREEAVAAGWSGEEYMDAVAAGWSDAEYAEAVAAGWSAEEYAEAMAAGWSAEEYAEEVVARADQAGREEADLEAGQAAYEARVAAVRAEAEAEWLADRAAYEAEEAAAREEEEASWAAYEAACKEDEILAGQTDVRVDPARASAPGIVSPR